MSKGHLEVIVGGMFSGKSEELLRRINRAKIANQKVVVFKHSADSRYDNNDVVSHSGLRTEAFPLFLTDFRPEIYNDKTGVYPDVVAIDEVQFFEKEDLLRVIDHWIENGVRVIVSGLDQDFRGQGFNTPLMGELVLRCKYIVKLTAVCQKCGQDATMTQRLIDGLPAPFEGDTILIGGIDEYEARCSNCHQRG